VPVTGGVLLRATEPGGVRLRVELVTGGVRLRDPVPGGVKLIVFALLDSDTLVDLLAGCVEFSASLSAALRRSISGFRPINS